MTDANEHARIVLSGIFPHRKDNLDYVIQHIDPEFIPDPNLRVFFSITLRYYEVSAGILHRDALSAIAARSSDPGKVALLEEIFDSLAETEVSDDQVRWSVSELKDLAAERATEEALQQAAQIFREGATDDAGEFHRGHTASRLYLMDRLAEIDRSSARLASPEGNIRNEAAAIMADYAERKHLRQTGASLGVRTGIDALDVGVGGFQRGDVALIVGATSAGKTAACAQLAWSACVEQGKNVVFLTTETLRPQVRRRVICRHSKLERFGLPEGLNTRDLKAGTLTAQEELKLHEVVDDFSNNPHYGVCEITQVPYGATISSLALKLLRYSREYEIDLVVMDYLRLLRSERKRQSDREEINSIIIEAKQLATTFADGKGIPFVSPWQVSRAAAELAAKTGYYTSAALAETAEASNTADVVIGLLATSGEPPGRYTELRGQVIKNRDGETSHGISIDVDYGTSTFTSKSSSSLGLGAGDVVNDLFN